MKCIGRCIVFLAILASLGSSGLAQNAFSYAEQRLVKSFEKRAVNYANTRVKIERRLPKLPKQASIEQIAAHKAALQAAIQKERAAEKTGNIFTPEAATMIRKMIKNEFKGWEGSEIRTTVLEAETKGVPVKINVPYPESAELVEMSPTLLLSLPQLPKTLRYRFVGRSLVIMDRDNALIIDYMTNALP